MSQKIVIESPRATFFDDLRATLQVLRSTVIELLASVDADPGKPQDLARRFGRLEKRQKDLDKLKEQHLRDIKEVAATKEQMLR